MDYVSLSAFIGEHGEPERSGLSTRDEGSRDGSDDGASRRIGFHESRPAKPDHRGGEGRAGGIPLD